MPISKTYEGLNYEWALDSVAYGVEGYFWNPGGDFWSADTTDKKFGAASCKWAAFAGHPGGTYATMSPVAVKCIPGDRIHIWHKSGDSDHKWELKVCCLGGSGSCPQDGIPYYSTTVITQTTAEPWTLKKGTIPSNFALGANRLIHASVITDTGTEWNPTSDWIDHLVICTSQYITVTGLHPGQKVAIYRSSDNVKISEATCAEGATSVAVDVDSEDYPEYMYLKVYATDSATLIETTSAYVMCGGDIWYWVSPYGSLTIATDAGIIIRTAGTGDPKTANIRATLLTLAGDPAPGKTIYFYASRGTLGAASDITDASGQAHTTLTSATHGIATVKAVWNGDVDIPAASAYTMLHIFYDAEVGDDDKAFQFYVEGVELSYSNGSYFLASSADPQEFSVEIPEWVSTITRRGLVSIYRKGVKDYGGVLTKIHRSMAAPPQVVLGGTDSKALLETRVVTLKDYSAKTATYMLNDLIVSYPCFISLGTIAEYATEFSMTFADETLVSSISRLCDVIGWVYRLNTDLTLDAAPSFGMDRSEVVFERGVNLFIAGNDEDYTHMCNSLRMKGKEALVSTQFDPASIESLGLVEDVAFQKSIDVQATLDIAAIAELGRRLTGAITIPCTLLDDNAVGAWTVNDWLTLTCSDVELSGTYKAVKVTRDMTDPRYAAVDFSNRAAVEMADVLDRLKRQLKDLNVA